MPNSYFVGIYAQIVFGLPSISDFRFLLNSVYGGHIHSHSAAYTILTQFEFDDDNLTRPKIDLKCVV